VVAQDSGIANLQKIEHIVVLMLENRSFDHKLGYLPLEGGRHDIDGLREEFASDHPGRRYPVRYPSATSRPRRYPTTPITAPVPSTCRLAGAK
jgi:phospholipase C